MKDYGLKPCPFMSCGSDDVGIVAGAHPKSTGELGVCGKCRVCGATGPICPSAEQAAFAWDNINR